MHSQQEDDMKIICLSLAAAAIAATAMPTGAAAVTGKLKKVSVGIHSETHRPAPPVVHVKFYDGRWRLVPNTKIYFDLWVYAKANVGTNIHHLYVTAPADGTFTQNRWKAGYNSNGGRKFKAVHTHHSMPQNALGKLGVKFVDFCKQQMPGGVGQFRKEGFMPVKIGVGMARGGLLSKVKFYYKTANRSIRISIYCDGGIAAPRSASAPKMKTVKGAGVKLTKVGKHCPRKVFASARIWTTKPTKVKYVLRSNRGRKWTRTMLIQFKNSKGVYEGSWDHSFTVKKSTDERFWIEIKGHNVGRPAFMKVTCVKQGPNGLAG